MLKGIKISIDVVSGEVFFDNEDELSYFEILGMVEMVKGMLIKQWMEEERI